MANIKRLVHAVPYVKTIADGDTQGLVESIVSVFINIDLVKDRIRPGAFTESLERWKNSGDLIPVIFSHQWENLDAYVGDVVEAEELFPGNPKLPEKLKPFGGLWTMQRYDIDEDLAARKVFKLLKKRRVREFSFAYDVLDEELADDGVNDLIKLDIIEVGPTMKGANQLTELIEAKAREIIEISGREMLRFPAAGDPQAKAGRVLSAKNEGDLRKARELIDGVLAKINDDSDDGKGRPADTSEGKLEDEPADTPERKSDDPQLTPSRTALFAEIEALDG